MTTLDFSPRICLTSWNIPLQVVTDNQEQDKLVTCS